MAYTNPYTDSSPWSRMANMLGGQLPPAGSPPPSPYTPGRTAGTGMGYQSAGAQPAPMPMPNNVWGNMARQFSSQMPQQRPAWMSGLTSSQGLSPQQLQEYMAANSGFTPENAAKWVAFQRDYVNTLDDSPGSADVKRAMMEQYKQFLLQQQNQGPIDFSGSSEVGDQFANARQRMLSLLAARGITGGGLEAGAVSNLAGAQGKAMGQFYRDALERRRLEGREDFQRWQQQQQRMLELLLGRNFAEEDKPGFGEQLLGFGGNVLGGFLPGLGGGGGGGNSRADASFFM